VLIAGKPAAREGDACAHGGFIITGCAMVLIGEIAKPIVYVRPGEMGVEEEFVEPSKEEKSKIINEAIKDCIDLLARKLKLLKRNDKKTLKQFKNWFGTTDKYARKVILERIEKALKVSRRLTESNFDYIRDELARKKTYAIVYGDDFSHTIYLGYSFWQAGWIGKNSKPGILIHELSHFEDIGPTKDVIYEEYGLDLGIISPKQALMNADSFEYFIEA